MCVRDTPDADLHKNKYGIIIKMKIYQVLIELGIFLLFPLLKKNYIMYKTLIIFYS